MQYCALEKEGFLGTFYERETPSEKAIILVGGSGEGRAVKVLQRAENRHEQAVPRRGVYAAVREWENRPKQRSVCWRK